jgi:pyruvate,water dikinase
MNSNDNQMYIVPFSKANEFGSGVIGTKGSLLGKLMSLHVPVPNGFIITTAAFNRFFFSNKLDEYVRKELVSINTIDSVHLENISKRIRSGILKISVDKDLKNKIIKAYTGLSGFSDTYVAIRSSSPIEDLKKDVFAGQYSTFLNIKGGEDVVEKLKYCWASLYSPENLFYALSQKIDINSLQIGVIVQKMVQAEVSGVLFTLNPIDNDATKISIEAVLGLGESLINGQITPDTYLIDKESNQVLEKHIVPQEWMLVRKGRTKKGEDPNIKVNVSEIWKSRQKLENKYIEKLVRIGKSIESDAKIAQEIEWTYEGGRLWIVQTRPIRTLKVESDESWKKTPTYAMLQAKIEGNSEPKEKDQSIKNNEPSVSASIPPLTFVRTQQTIAPQEIEVQGNKILLSGLGVNGGEVSGSVQIVHSSQDLLKVKKGNIIVTSEVTLEFKDKLVSAVGLLTDEGGKNSYAAIIAQRLGIPCVVDMQIATKVLRNGEEITMNGNTGEVVVGATSTGLVQAEKIVQNNREEEKKQEKKVSKEKYISSDEETIMPQIKTAPVQIKTATKLFAYIDDPSLGPSYARNDFDGVGVFGPEYSIREVKIHPQQAFKREGDTESLLNALTVGLFRVARSFEPRPLLYQFSNMTSSDYIQLLGGDMYESSELNPMVGLRGASRFLVHPEEINVELEAIKNVRNKEHIRNIWLAFPFVRTSHELREMKHLVSAYGFRRSSTMKFFLSVETPGVAVRIEKFIDMGIDGISINLNNMRDLLFGVDRNNPKLVENFEYTHPALLWIIERVIKACHKAKIHSHVLGQVSSTTPLLIKKLVEWGVTSFSSDEETLGQVRKMVSEAERNLLLKKKK